MKMKVPDRKPVYAKENMKTLLNIFLSEDQQKGDDWLSQLKTTLEEKKKAGLKLPNIIAH